MASQDALEDSWKKGLVREVKFSGPGVRVVSSRKVGAFSEARTGPGGVTVGRIGCGIGQSKS